MIELNISSLSIKQLSLPNPLYSYYLFKETFKWEHMRQVDIKTGYKIKSLIY